MHTPEDMLTLAKNVANNAYSPYSKLKVGACLRSNNDRLFSGCNVENVSYGLTICAEASAVTAMVAAGDKEVTELVLVVESDELIFPCGACRQRLFEFCKSDITLHIHNNKECLHTSLIALFPKPFNKSQLETQ